MKILKLFFCSPCTFIVGFNLLRGLDDSKRQLKTTERDVQRWNISPTRTLGTFFILCLLTRALCLTPAILLHSPQYFLPSLLCMLSHEIYVLWLYDGVNEKSFAKQQKGGRGGGGGGERLVGLYVAPLSAVFAKPYTFLFPVWEPIWLQSLCKSSAVDENEWCLIKGDNWLHVWPDGQRLSSCEQSRSGHSSSSGLNMINPPGYDSQLLGRELFTL